MEQVDSTPALRRFIVLVLSFACFPALAQPIRQDRLQHLYDHHQWFTLRDRLQGDKTVAPLYRGAVAAAFNDRAGAERAFAELFQQEAQSEAAYQAHEWLTYLYLRAGLYSRAVAETKAKWRARPDRANSPEEQRVVAMFDGLPDQTTQAVVPSAPSSVRCPEAGILPLQVNGKRAEFLVDTDAYLSFLSESAARVLGLPIRSRGAEAHGTAGKSERTRTAFAETVTIGGFRLQNVLFLVFPDTMGAFEGSPVTRQGALGVPVLAALEQLQLASSGACAVGGTPQSQSAPVPNLAFDGDDPITEITVQGRKAEVIFDTGAEETELFPRFAEQFPELMRTGVRSSPKIVRGFGGGRAIPQVEISNLKVEFAGFGATLHPAHVLLETTVPSSRWEAGRLGADALGQTHQITINYKHMTIAAE